jgi:hypothetical protein
MYKNNCIDESLFKEEDSFIELKFVYDTYLEKEGLYSYLDVFSLRFLYFK